MSTSTVALFTELLIFQLKCTLHYLLLAAFAVGSHIGESKTLIHMQELVVLDSYTWVQLKEVSKKYSSRISKPQLSCGFFIAQIADQLLKTIMFCKKLKVIVLNLTGI